MSNNDPQEAAANQIARPTPEPKKGQALAAMADRIQVDQDKLLTTLKNTVFKGANNEELLALVAVSNEYSLNPLTKQIYAFPAKGGGIVPVVSIDGWVAMCNNHPEMDGMVFENEIIGDKLMAVTCKIYRKDRSHPIQVTEYLEECKRSTDPWRQMPSRMLRHKALMQCTRYAFGFSGVTDEDEAADTPGMRNVTRQETSMTEEVKPVFTKRQTAVEVDPIDEVEDYEDLSDCGFDPLDMPEEEESHAQPLKTDLWDEEGGQA